MSSIYDGAGVIIHDLITLTVTRTRTESWDLTLTAADLLQYAENARIHDHGPADGEDLADWVDRLAGQGDALALAIVADQGTADETDEQCEITDGPWVS